MIQLEEVAHELEDARRRAHQIADSLTEESWGSRPAPDEWSVAECLIHLNLTSQAMLPLIRDAIVRGREGNLLASGPYRRDPVGWFVNRLVEPPAWFRVKIKTTPPFVPAAVEPKDRVLAAFDTLQEQLVGYAREAHGFDLSRLRIVSPFDARLKYNLYSCFRIIPAHERLHLAQAEGVIRRMK